MRYSLHKVLLELRLKDKKVQGSERGAFQAKETINAKALRQG
jgi:hypothetical protein